MVDFLERIQGAVESQIAYMLISRPVIIMIPEVNITFVPDEIIYKRIGNGKAEEKKDNRADVDFSKLSKIFFHNAPMFGT